MFFSSYISLPDQSQSLSTPAWDAGSFWHDHRLFYPQNHLEMSQGESTPLKLLAYFSLAVPSMIRSSHPHNASLPCKSNNRLHVTQFIMTDWQLVLTHEQMKCLSLNKSSFKIHGDYEVSTTHRQERSSKKKLSQGQQVCSGSLHHGQGKWEPNLKMENTYGWILQNKRDLLLQWSVTPNKHPWISREKCHAAK